MKAIKLILAVIALGLSFDNLDRKLPRIGFYWLLVAVYWILNALT